MKDNNKENIQQNDEGVEPNKGIKTPEPPQKKDPGNRASAEGGEGGNEKSGKAPDAGTDRTPAAKEQSGGNTGKQVPANNKEEQTKPPTTTTNR
ncbi:hypothetical protein [Cesiribacter sp. SM1]|uniref:hypothetical protein n=1 Tax=Cesiribacter sp. SM1 TaxID=2861196 RepID=UPI001CD4F0DB|nr:hypothetical protein [Cesiribacter sp. SM1]